MSVLFLRAFPLDRTHQDRKQLTDYYFWELDQFSAELPYICERHQTDIGCIQVQPLQYLAGYYHINDGYLVDTKYK